jgi:hypothetical protein
MQLTIIPSDKIVLEDGVGYTPLDMSSVPIGVHALQFDTAINYGWIEYDLLPDGTLPQNEDITTLPDWAVTCQQEWATADYNAKNPPAPTPEELKAQCKARATNYLNTTDWTAIPDVADPAKSNPYLMNQADFVAYRSTVRNLAVYPVVDPVFPTVPVEQWSS